MDATSDTFTHPYPTNNYVYQDAPHWHGTYVVLYLAGGNGQNVYTTLTWKRGTATYYLSVNFNFLDNEGWPVDGYCK